ncbi:GNAT family N-acetyltransferase [Oceanibacterium hippocampi]|nr:GNAT family N-acyltransferase [Oceanibacterium hippocampi]
MQVPLRSELTREPRPWAEAFPLAVVDGRLEVRLARSDEEIARSQALRYQIFYREMAALATPAMDAARRDFDAFDALCDHLLVIDREEKGPNNVVGTYRLLRQAVAEKHDGFYSADEYDLTPLLGHPVLNPPGKGGLMELGRSCVRRDHRNTATIQLLWRGIAAYMEAHAITALFGCASLPGVDPKAHAQPLSYLHHNHLAPEDLRVRAVAERYEEMNLLPADQINARRAFMALPPLVKGYIRLGAHIGQGAVVDHQFGTTDVFVLLPVERIGERYFGHFDRGDRASRRG